MKLKKKELLQSPLRQWTNVDKEYNEILIVPSGRKHCSGWMSIAVIGVWVEDGQEKYEIAAYPDDISYFFPIRKIAEDLQLTTVRQDCHYPQGVLRYHGDGIFKVSAAVSSVDIHFLPKNKKGI
jgi:hypothetical protein